MSSGMLRRVALVRTDFAEKRIASIIRVKRISELGTTLAAIQLIVTANVVLSSLVLFILMMEAIRSSKTSDTRVTRCHMTEDDILIISSF
jgi:hypothetical protein